MTGELLDFSIPEEALPEVLGSKIHDSLKSIGMNVFDKVSIDFKDVQVLTSQSIALLINFIKTLDVMGIKYELKHIPSHLALSLSPLLDNMDYKEHLKKSSDSENHDLIYSKITVDKTVSGDENTIETVLHAKSFGAANDVMATSINKSSSTKSLTDLLDQQNDVTVSTERLTQLMQAIREEKDEDDNH